MGWSESHAYNACVCLPVAAIDMVGEGCPIRQLSGACFAKQQITLLINFGFTEFTERTDQRLIREFFSFFFGWSAGGRQNAVIF
jgi:hypothetical protein